MIQKEHILNLVNKSIEGTDMFVTNITVSKGNLVKIFLDGDSNVTIENCVEVSHFIEASLDRETEDFELQVSSHGLTSPLLVARQYKKNIGKNIDALLLNGIKIKGEITEADETGFNLLIKNSPKKQKKEQSIPETKKINYTDIKEVKLNISF